MKVLPFKRPVQRKLDPAAQCILDLSTTKYWQDVMEQNRQNVARLQQERRRNNQSITRAYRPRR